MTARVCDSCQSVVDGSFDALNRSVAQRGAAEGTAAVAVDLLARWGELVLERRHTPSKALDRIEDELLAITRRFVLTSPPYARSVLRATHVEEVAAGGEGEDPTAAASPTRTPEAY